MRTYSGPHTVLIRFLQGVVPEAPGPVLSLLLAKQGTSPGGEGGRHTDPGESPGLFPILEGGLF